MTKQPDTESGITLHLTSDESLVLFELLHRWSGDKDAGDTPGPSCFVSTAEGAALNSLLADLERQLVPPFENDYAFRLKEARERLSHSWSYSTLRGKPPQPVVFGPSSSRT